MGGLTNHSYYVQLDDCSEYALRLPGEGTENMIDRRNERISTELACRLGVDTELLFFGEDGSKLTRYIPDAITMSPESLKNELRIRQLSALLKTMHSCGQDTGVPFDVFSMAASYEQIISDMHVPMFDDYPLIKARVLEIKNYIDSSRNVKLVPCHNDPLCENWVVGGERMYLIDWEYAGMNDGMWDLADVSIEAGFMPEHDVILLSSYLEKSPDKDSMEHFLANKIYVDFLWTLWAKARVPYDGQAMDDWATERYARLKKNLLLIQT